MPKITVRDIFKEFHTFQGDVFAVEQDGGCKVFQRQPDGKNVLLQSFGPHVFGWMRQEQDKGEVIGPIDAPALDRFTAQSLAGLQGRPTIKDEDEIPDFLPPAAEDESQDHDDEGPAPLRVTDAGLKAIQESESQPPAPEKKKRIRPSRAKPKPDAAAATMAAAIEEGLIPQEGPANVPGGVLSTEPGIVPGEPATGLPLPTLDDLMAQGLVKKGVDSIATDLADTVMDEKDPAEVIKEAEQKHSARQNCETCKGRGVVPDPESDDPLDTVLCPAC